MKMKRLGLSLFALVLTLAGASSAAHALQGPPPPPGWDAPPASYRSDVERRGYHDGIDGARKDRDNGRPPNVMNRDEYRHPDVPPPAWRAYQRAFRAGYSRGVNIFYRRR